MSATRDMQRNWFFNAWKELTGTDYFGLGYSAVEFDELPKDKDWAGRFGVDREKAARMHTTGDLMRHLNLEHQGD